MSAADALFLKCSTLGRAEAAREVRNLTRVAGPGVVPLRSTGSAGNCLPSGVPDIRDHGSGSLECGAHDGGSTEGVSRHSCLILAEAACSLADVLAERGPMPKSEVRGVAVAAARSLARVHEAGLVHGDVKPANLLLSRGGQLWLADFDAAVPSDGRLLMRGSPYRVSSSSRAAPATDISALAVTLVELATGTLVDPAVEWQAADLRRLGCPPGLCTDIACVMEASQASAGSVAAFFARRGRARLPEPAVRALMQDSTPTVDFTLG